MIPAGRTPAPALPPLSWPYANSVSREQARPNRRGAHLGRTPHGAALESAPDTPLQLLFGGKPRGAAALDSRFRTARPRSARRARRADDVSCKRGNRLSASSRTAIIYLGSRHSVPFSALAHLSSHQPTAAPVGELGPLGYILVIWVSDRVEAARS